MVSSSETSEEDLEKFAAIAGIVDTEVSEKCKSDHSHAGSSKRHSKPSLRHWQKDEDISCSRPELITPEFRQHVAKKLSKFLDSSYICTQEVGHTQIDYHNNFRKSSGIKLLLTSKQRLQEESVKEIPSFINSKKNKKKHCLSNSDSDTDEEELNRLAEAAVSGHSIIQNVYNESQEQANGEITEKTSVKRQKDKKSHKDKKKRRLDEDARQKKKRKKQKKDKRREET